MSIIGIHKGGIFDQRKKDQSCNGGRILTEELIDKLQKMTNKLGAIPFKHILEG